MEPLQRLIESLMDSVARGLPLGYAFGVGMVATVNPCGFALLPAYLSLFLGADADRRAGRDGGRQLLRAVVVSVSITTGFVVLFGAIGLTVAAGGRFLSRIMPWASLAIGVALVALGALLLLGKGIYPSAVTRLAARVPAGRGGIVSSFLFGIAYAIASLGCTLPLFLVIVDRGVRAGGVASGARQFIAYALGMGLVVTALTLAAAFFKGALAGYLRRAMPFIQKASALIVIAAGVYIIVYWLTKGRSLLT